MRIYELVVEPDREDHIARHGVTLEEVEDVVFTRPYVRRTRQGRFRLIGQTDAGRYLTIILAPREADVFGLVTARDATVAERRAYGIWRR